MDGPCQAWLCLVVPDPGSHRTEPNSLPGTSLLPSSPKPISHASGFHPQKPSVFVEIDLGDHAEEVRCSDHKAKPRPGGRLAQGHEGFQELAQHSRGPEAEAETGPPGGGPARGPEDASPRPHSPHSNLHPFLHDQRL